MWSDFFTVSVIVAMLSSAVRFATPFLLASLGETIGQRSGAVSYTHLTLPTICSV